LYAGVRETHELRSERALLVVGVVYFVWLVVAGIISIGLTTG
jgi:hypothetical protein